MNLGGIYKIISKTHPERIYIGSTVDFHTRWSRHRSDLKKGKHSNPIIQSHYNKYGLDDFEFSVVAICEKEELMPLFCQKLNHKIIYPEQFFIWAYNPYFNISPTAGSLLGHKMSEESKNKLSKSITGRPHSIKGIPAWNKGLTKNTDSRVAKLSQKNSGQFEKGFTPWNKGIKTGSQSEESNRKRSTSLVGHRAWNKGLPAWNKGLTKETDERVKRNAENTSKALKGCISPHKGKKRGKQSAETIEKRVSHFRGKKRNAETRRKISEALMGNKNGLGNRSRAAYKESQDKKIKI